MDVIEWCEDHGMAGRVVWRESIPFRTWTGPEGQQNIAVGHPAYWCPAGPHDPPDKVCVALLPNGRRWLRDQRLGKAPADKANTTAQPKEPAHVRAMAILLTEPNIVPTELARRVGVSRGTLYGKRPPWKAIRDTLLARPPTSCPHGTKDRDGNIEAWRSDPDTEE